MIRDMEYFRFAITEADGQTIVPTDELSPGPRILDGPKHWMPPLDKTPIHCLPNEILREILIYVPMIESYQLTRHYHMMSLWPSASQVCSRWHKITLNTPDFWTFMPLQTRHTRWLDLALERSHPLPISLHISGDFCALEWYRHAALRVAPATSRAREICFEPCTLSEDYEEFFDQLLSKMGAGPAPFLEIFESEGAFGSHLDFGGEVPSKLRTVKVASDAFASQLLLMFHASLTHLELEEVSHFGVLEALRRLPCLQTLILSDACDIRLPSLPDEPSKVLLPHLRRLDLFGSYKAFVGFMHYVCIPSHTEMHIRTYDGRPTEDHIKPMILSMTKAFFDHFHAPLADSFFQNLTINPRPYQQAVAGAFLLSNPTRTPRSSTQLESGLPPQILLDISVKSYVSYRPQLIPRLLLILGSAIRAIQMLDVHGSMMRCLQEWMDISQCLGQVSQINVSDTSAHGLVMALAATSTRVPIFPRLDTLSIERVIFAAPIDERPGRLYRNGRNFHHPRRFPKAMPEDSVPFTDGLLQALANRAATGHSIKRLAITDCIVAAEMAPLLQDSPGVDSLDWDGRVNGAIHEHLVPLMARNISGTD